MRAKKRQMNNAMVEGREMRATKRRMNNAMVGRAGGVKTDEVRQV